MNELQNINIDNLYKDIVKMIEKTKEQVAIKSIQN